ncbi:MAG TPA: PQQ-binding-like beta-propeller repeat protein [Acetobacteraceae bacterium]|nr:PQQ-binding-like beta-propeller repeat protein [Acetobacteraceae bacterium]
MVGKLYGALLLAGSMLGALPLAAAAESATPNIDWPGYNNDYQARRYPPESASGWITSIDASTGQVNWKFHAPAPVVSGITPTAGGIVFGGDTKGNFFALDSSSGQTLFSLSTHGMIAGGVVTYAVGGRQYVAFTSGNVSRITFGELGAPTLIVVGLEQAYPKEAGAKEGTQP